MAMQLSHSSRGRLAGFVPFGLPLIMFLFSAASTMNLLYLRTPENHISGIALSRGYLLKP
jgi:hypothetical protein